MNNYLIGLRADIDALNRRTGGDLLAQVSRAGLKVAFDKIAPPDLRFNTRGTTLEVSALNRVPIPSKRLSMVEEHFSRAVAAIGSEIREPGASRRISQADYASAPIYTRTTPDGLILFLASPSDHAISGHRVESLAEQALTRLAELLPESAEDPSLQARLDPLRTPSLRAVHEVAEAAKSMHGLTATLVKDGSRSVESVVTNDQADWIANLLDDERTTVSRISVRGRLDGLRFKRRMFYLEPDKGRDVIGTVDEQWVDPVKSLLNQPVDAILEKVTRVNRAGIQQQPAYRLVGVAAPAALP